MKAFLVFLLKNYQTPNLLMYISSELRGKPSEEIKYKAQDPGAGYPSLRFPMCKMES